jgi:hypothetical protein
LAARVSVPVDNAYLAAFGRKRACNGFADAGSSAGDHRDATFQV